MLSNIWLNWSQTIVRFSLAKSPQKNNIMTSAYFRCVDLNSRWWYSRGYCRRGYTTSYCSNPSKHFIVAIAIASQSYMKVVHRDASQSPPLTYSVPSLHRYTSPLLQPAPPPHHIWLKSLEMFVCFCGPSYSLRKLQRVVHLMQCTKTFGTSPTTSDLDTTSDSPHLSALQ